jgi:myo-inositol-1(or 4)-monophosphatase
VDVAAEELIRARLRDACPDDGIVGEEGDDVPGTSGRWWVVDPLDGTVNYLFGIPQWCVSIALDDVCGVVYDPMRDECWSCAAGGPPRLNGVEVGASGRTEMATALVATGFGYDSAVREVQGAIAARLLPQVRDIRRLGSAALDLAWTAGGRYDAYFERGVKRWDVAAGAMLCRGAGLEVHELAPVSPSDGGILVAPGAFAQELLDAVR